MCAVREAVWGTATDDGDDIADIVLKHFLARAAQALIARNLARDRASAAPRRDGGGDGGGGGGGSARRVASTLVALSLALAALFAAPLLLGAAAAVSGDDGRGAPGAPGARAFARAFTRDPAVEREVARTLPLLGALAFVAAPAYVLDGVLMGAGDFAYLARFVELSMGRFV